MTETPDPAVHFATSLAPHRSLSPEGFSWLIRAVHRGQPGDRPAHAVCWAPGRCWASWASTSALLWWLFKRSYLDARRSETLLLTDRELIVDRVAPDGEREQHRLDSYWLRRSMSGERLVVTSRGNRVVIGRFLARRSARSARLKPRSPRCAPRVPDWEAATGLRCALRASPRLGLASSEAQHVLHAVEAGRLALQP